MRRQIRVLYTGGTIGMRQSAQGLVPDAALAATALRAFAERYDFHWQLCQPLIDSSAVTLADWADWVVRLRTDVPDYDGVLVLHGTDTLAYTANLLAFALRGLDKPVVLTGAQWPFGAPGSDAADNLATAVAAFDLPGLRQVVLAFDRCLWPAVGSRKISTETAAGFGHAHAAPLARYDGNAWSAFQAASLAMAGERAFAPVAIDPSVRVVSYYLTPGASPAMIAHSLRQFDSDAAIVHSFGHGNAPDDADLLAAVRGYSDQGKVLVNISQVAQGQVAPVYAQGSGLRTAGAFAGGRWTVETALAKLTVGLSMGLRGTALQAMLAENWLGEWSDPLTAV